MKWVNEEAFADHVIGGASKPQTLKSLGPRKKGGARGLRVLG